MGMTTMTEEEVMAALTLADNRSGGWFGNTGVYMYDYDYSSFFGLTPAETRELVAGYVWRCQGGVIGGPEWHRRICAQIAAILNARGK